MFQQPQVLPMAGDWCECSRMSGWPVCSNHWHAAPQIQRWVLSSPMCIQKWVLMCHCSLLSVLLYINMCVCYRSLAPWSERCSVAVLDAVLWELHLSAHAWIPALPVPYTPPQPAVETPAPWYSAHGAALQSETLHYDSWTLTSYTAHWSVQGHRRAC